MDKKIYPEIDVQMYKTEDGDSWINIKAFVHIERDGVKYELLCMSKSKCYSNEIFHVLVSNCFQRFIKEVEFAREKFQVSEEMIKEGLITIVNKDNGEG